MYGFTGNGKVLNNVNRSDILFQAKRGIQEFSYEITRVEKIQEVEVSSSLSVPMPQDYVNYVQLSIVDNGGIEHIIHPARYTSVPSQSILQSATGEYLYDISVEMQPTLAEAYRLRMANSNSSKIAEIKGKAAAVIMTNTGS